MSKADANNKLLKIFYTIWLVNLPYFTLSLWFFAYYKHIGHWAEAPLHAMMISGGILKAVLSVAILITLVHRKNLEEAECK